MRKILASLSYDGTNYCGWQRQKNSVSVQQKLEEALERLEGRHITARGASRTDAGVHALDQKAVFETDMRIPAEKFPFAINSMLPNDITVTQCREVGEDFHPQYDVVKKTYEYNIYNAVFPNPLFRRYSAFVPKKLDIEKMNEACGFFKGEYDFRAFCSADTSAKSTIRQIYDIYAEKNGDIVNISVTGNGFLYNMVRIIAGTLIYVGTGKMKPYDVMEAITSRDRKKAGPTAPPQGLVLKKIYY